MAGGTRLKAEAEYTAALAFSIAVAASWWAARVGKARLKVPRMPAIETVGRREHWLEFDARALREWAMAPMAVSLGLQPPPLASGATVPLRAVILEVLYEDGTLPEDVVYVGRGHHSHRVSTSDWKCPHLLVGRVDPTLCAVCPPVRPGQEAGL